MKKTFLIFVLLVSGWLMSTAEVMERVVLYPSVNPQGDTITLSGKLCVPMGKKPKGLILIPHYTITSKYQAPSVKPTGEAAFFKDDYVLVMPDYIGYGVTAEMEHPYLAGELTAHNCIDMLFGVQPVLDSLQCGVNTDSLYIVGYSQGGASAVWIFKVLEEQYPDRFHVLGCYAGGGPYDVTATYEDALQRKKVFMPIVIPMVVMGADVAYDLKLDRTAFFTPEMQEIYTKYVANKEYTTTDIFFHVRSHRIDRWLTPLALDPTNPEMLPLYEAFKRFSIVRYPLNDEVADREVICLDWTPKAPLYIFHSKGDNVVTVHCAEHLRRCLPDAPNIRFDIGRYGSHTHASARFFKRVRKMLR